MIYFIEHLFKWGTLTAYLLLTKGQFKKKSQNTVLWKLTVSGVSDISPVTQPVLALSLPVK